MSLSNSLTGTEEALEPPSIQFDTAKWDSKLKQAENLRISFERQWFTNMAFYKGNQWVRWVKNMSANSGQSMLNPPAAPHRKRLVYNKIKPIVRNEFTKLIKEEQQGFVAPNTSDAGDIASSKTAESLVDFLFYAGKYNRARHTAVWWATICGVGYTKTWYDEGKKIPKNKKLGAISFDAPSPFHIFVPHLDILDIQDQPWVSQAAGYDPSYVKAQWGVDIVPDTETGGLGFEQRFLSSININKTNRFQQVQVKEVWIKPCGEYPKGALVIYAGSTVLYSGDFPYEHGEYPFQKIDHIPTGAYYAQSTIDDLISPQKEYNLTRSQIAEARDLTSKPALVVTRGAQDVKKIRAVPGQIIEVQPGADRPTRLVNPDMPNYVNQDLERTAMDMDEISGQFEVTKGKTPPGVEAASAIAYLQEENDTRLYHTIASIEAAVACSGQQSLHLVQQFWDTERIISTVSKTNVQGAIKFKAADLKNNTDYRVVADSMAPRSRAAKQASILEMIKMQMIDPKLGLKNMNMSETAAMYDEMQVNENQAMRENLRMADGEEVLPNAWDEHAIHVIEHTNYMKTQEFELLPDEVKSIFINHYEAHQKVFIEEVKMQAGEIPNPDDPQPQEDMTNG